MKYYAITPKFCNVTRYAKEKDSQRLYDLIFSITQNNNDTETAIKWTETALTGKTYCTNLLTIEIAED